MQKLPKKGIITLAFDDAYLDTYKHAIKYLSRLKIKSTVAVSPSFIGKTFENRRVMGLGELKGLMKSGHEIASHTLTHPNLLRLTREDEREAIREIAESKEELRKRLGCKINSFVFPYISKNHSRSLRLKTKNYYRSARITSYSPSFNKIPVKDAHSILGFSIMKKHSLAFLKKQVDHAARKGIWLIEVFHLVSKRNTLSARTSKPYRFFMHIDDFKRHVDYILSKDVLILTQKGAVH